MRPVVDQALAVTVEVLDVPAQLRAEAGRPAPVELHRALAPVAQAAAHRSGPAVFASGVAETDLAVSDVLADVRIVIALGSVGGRLRILGNSPPRPQRQPPAVAPVEGDLGEQAIPAARKLVRTTVRLVNKTGAGQARRPAEQRARRPPRGKDFGLVAVLAKRRRALGVVGLPPRLAGIGEEQCRPAFEQRRRQRQLETELELDLVALNLSAGRTRSRGDVRVRHQVIRPVRQQREALAPDPRLADDAALDRRRGHLRRSRLLCQRRYHVGAACPDLRHREVGIRIAQTLQQTALERRQLGGGLCERLRGWQRQGAGKQQRDRPPAIVTSRCRPGSRRFRPSRRRRRPRRPTRPKRRWPRRWSRSPRSADRRRSP